MNLLALQLPPSLIAICDRACKGKYHNETPTVCKTPPLPLQSMLRKLQPPIPDAGGLRLSRPIGRRDPSPPPPATSGKRNSVLGFVVKPLTFHNEKPDTKVRRVIFMRRALFPRFSLRFLEAPTMRRGFEGAPLSFLPRRSDGTQQDRRGREDTD